ncbi:hypothetical protein TYRP_003845 [Tyrophagus putrescentiae]|nr:hypothetical protein TYRP_003845 [Tyrophagus putrescentiae]
MVPFDAERLVECLCASETSISRVLSEISAIEVLILVSCIASTTGTPDSCQQTVFHVHCGTLTWPGLASRSTLFGDGCTLSWILIIVLVLDLFSRRTLGDFFLFR